MNKASKEAGGGLEGTELRALNKRMQQMMTIQDILEHNAIRYARNDTFSLTAKMAGMGEMAGALAAGHPMAALGAIPVAMATEAVKYHGNAYAALMLDRLAKFGGISKAAGEFDGEIDAAVNKVLSGKRSGIKRVAMEAGSDALEAVARKRTASDREYKAEESRVRQLAAMAPALVAEHLQDRTGPLATHMPGVAAKVVQMAMAQTKYLASKLPPEPMTAQASLTPQLSKTQATQAEKATLLRAVAAVEGGPPAIMKRLGKGAVTPEDVEVLRDFYPKSFEEIQHKIMAKCADRTKPLDFQTRIQLGTLFGVPTDPMLQPQFLAHVDQSFAVHPQAPSSQGNAPAPKRSAPAELSVQKSTASQFEQARGA
jgi:hypothetical protein